jgi:glucose-1-phosphate thymidylyltransferase
MKGIILSGGAGTRLYPLTKVTSKQLLPIYDKPMIYYPLEKLIRAGVKEILIIVAPDHCGDYMRVLGSGRDFGQGVRFTYEIQDKPEGLAHAFIVAENFLDDGDDVTMILGDNIFEDDVTPAISNFKSGATIFVKKVPKEDLTRLGNVVLDKDNNVLDIIEKPKDPKSPYAQPGIYIYDKQVVEAAKSLKPSARGELEITDLNNWYRERGQLRAEHLHGAWIDAGTIEAYFQANSWARDMAHKNESTFGGLSLFGK